MIGQYFKYRKNAVNAHGIHSPFVYEFYQEVVRKKNHKQFPEIEAIRKSLKADQTAIEVTDFGAGSRQNTGRHRSISSIAKTASISKKKGAFFSRIVAFYKLREVLELGTSLGLSGAYLASSHENVNLTTIEGCPVIADLANSNFKQLNLKNIHQKVGQFDHILATDTNQYDLIYIDGNHQYQPTIEYFRFALEHTHDDAFIIFDDIRWSKEMESAWEDIIKSDKVHVTMDFFQFGIVCKRPAQRKQHFTLKF